MQGRKPTLTPLVAPGSPGSPDLAASGKFRVGDFEIGRAGIRPNGSSSTSAEAPPPATAAAALDFGELRLLDVIGRGASGFVRRASHDPSGRVLAVKEISVSDEGRRKQIFQEISTLLATRTPHLVRCDGVRYVEVMSGGWDTHSENFDRLEDLTPQIDQGLSALLADLDARGLLQDTLVVLASEFGRTPDIDEDNGRNHYPKAFSTLLAGGGVRGGQRYGKTDKEGREPDSEPTSIQDLNATIAYACGLPTDHKLYSPSGRPFQVADKGMAITEIF